jgi:hypothetical protein
MIGLTAITSNLNWGKKYWGSIIENDAKGYYAYLPALFIYHDVNFGFFDHIESEKYKEFHLFYDYRAQSNGKMVSKYYCGAAVAELPFFLAVHAITTLNGGDADGYSRLYPIAITIAALCYLLLGLIFLNLTLGLYQIQERIKVLVLIACAFGTNLFYYTVGEPGMSHVFSFAFISMFLYYAKKFFLYPDRIYITKLSILLGIIILIRPINGLIILSLPFIAGSWLQLQQGLSALWSHKIRLLVAAISCLFIVSIQFIFYKVATGQFFIYSYGGEGFDFLNPHFFDILFSYKKGLFLYTPIYFVALTGLIFLWQSSKFQFFSWLAFFICITYIFSSWWVWFYGGSFSSRVYVEYLPLFMILLALSAQNAMNRLAKNSLVIIVVLLIFICQIQTYQYRYYYIHWEDQTKEKYWAHFLRIDLLMKKK